ncbi:MAG: hypothetical protein JRN59_09000 [Nitrososphaerota archaeon]|nr:hypothetical protein [Nitrososphaerota archaeon]
MSRYKDAVLGAVANPGLVVRGIKGEKKAIKWIEETHLGGKYLVVVYREKEGVKAIITAYFTSDLKRIKGEVKWKV